MRRVRLVGFTALSVALLAVSTLTADDPPGGGGGNPSITITKGEYVWNKDKTMVRPNFDGSVANAQGYTVVQLQRNVNNVWTTIKTINLTVDGSGAGTWSITDAPFQLNVNSSFRVLMKMLASDADNAATTKSAEMNLTRLTN